jgi:hypothetical protein
MDAVKSRREKIALAAIFWLITLGGAASAKSDNAKPTFKFEFGSQPAQREKPSIAAIEEQDRTVFLITSSTGIGGAKIILESGKWPRNIVLRFQYRNEEGFKYLESLRLVTARMMVEGSQQLSGAMPFYLPDETGKTEITTAPAGTLNITIEQRTEAMAVTLPANLFVGSGQIEIGWIDAYR